MDFIHLLLYRACGHKRCSIPHHTQFINSSHTTHNLQSSIHPHTGPVCTCVWYVCMSALCSKTLTSQPIIETHVLKCVWLCVSKAAISHTFTLTHVKHVFVMSLLLLDWVCLPHSHETPSFLWHELSQITTIFPYLMILTAGGYPLCLKEGNR